jgi:hypothetical protein
MSKRGEGAEEAPGMNVGKEPVVAISSQITPCAEGDESLLLFVLYSIHDTLSENIIICIHQPGRSYTV